MEVRCPVARAVGDRMNGVKRITVEVSQDDINAGIPGWSGNQPVGYALEWYLADDCFVEGVFTDDDGNITTAAENQAGEKFQIELPEIAQNFTKMFNKDGRSGVQPFSFGVALPESMLSSLRD